MFELLIDALSDISGFLVVFAAIGLWDILA